MLTTIEMPRKLYGQVCRCDFHVQRQVLSGYINRLHCTADTLQLTAVMTPGGNVLRRGKINILERQ